MTAPVILAVSAAGGRFAVRGDRLRLRARTALPDAVVEAAFAEVRDWHRRHAAALVRHRRLHPEAEAAALAWGEMQNRWHRLYGARAPEWTCAECGDPIGGRAALDIGDDVRVHLGGAYGSECLIAYGRRWRGDASRALAAMGLPPPADEDADEAPVTPLPVAARKRAAS